MTSSEKKERGLISYPQGNLESPFLNEELFGDDTETVAESHLETLQGESEFQYAFEEGLAARTQRESSAEELVEEEEAGDDFSVDEAEAYDEESPADLEDSLEEAYDEDEAEYMEGETEDGKPVARMKFEFQTRNRIFRNDGKTSSPLGRKYGRKDFLVDKKGVRLESETDGVLEFETEWFRTWPKLEKAIKKALEMIDDMNKAGPSKFNRTRKAFPFNVDHLRTAVTPTEKRTGFFDRLPGMETKNEKILGTNEELEIEIIDDKWEAAIQSSESFLLEYYESFMREHRPPSVVDDIVKRAQTILDAANTDAIPARELVKLRSFLQIVVSYIKAGRSVDVKGKPSKFAFRLMSRTNFASMYGRLLSGKEKTLFKKMVITDAILKEMGLDRKDPFFKNGYGTDPRHPQTGPTVYAWLSKFPHGVDLLSAARDGSGLSAAMGRYRVENTPGRKDRWHVKFETRNPSNLREAKDWVKFASDLFDLASKRESNAVSLAVQQGITGEDALTNFVFHARHPELRGRRIRKDERDLAEKWRRIRNDLVRPILQRAQPELEDVERPDDRYEQSYPSDPDTEGYAEENEAEDTDGNNIEMSADEYLASETIGEAEDAIEVADEEVNEDIKAHEVDPSVLNIVEKTIAREDPLIAYQVSNRWTRCFSAEDITKVEKVYADNALAASSNENDRASCIVMLNVALGQLLPLPLKQHRARGNRPNPRRPLTNRFLQMGDLSTYTIDKAMQELRQKGLAVAPIVTDFFDRRNRTAGTLKPERLKASVQDKVLAASKTKGCWFAFGLSVFDATHSVLLLVDHTAAEPKIYWLDQYSRGLTADINLDQRLTEYTQRVWQAVLVEKGSRRRTTIRLYPLRKPVTTS